MKKLKRAVIKEEYVAITGDYVAAIILNQFIYWVDRMKTVDEYIEQENQRAKANGKTNNIELSRGWIYKTAEELNDELMLGVSANTIRKYIKVLLDKGFLHERRNPAHKWDRTLQYRVDLVAVGKALKKCGYVLSDYKIELQDEEEPDKDSDFTPIEKIEVHNEGFEDYNEEVEAHNTENFETIPEIIPETPSETTPEREKQKRKRFVPPTLKEVEAYCLEKGYNIDAEHFINYYAARGWYLGKTKMKDWKAAVFTWVKRDNINKEQTTPEKPIYNEYGLRIDPDF